MNILKSTLETVSTLASLRRDAYLYRELSNEGKRQIKANALYTISFAATFATTSAATALLGASIIASYLPAESKDLGEIGLKLLGTYTGGVFSMTVAAPANLIISHLVSSNVTDKFFPKQPNDSTNTKALFPSEKRLPNDDDFTRTSPITSGPANCAPEKAEQ